MKTDRIPPETLSGLTPHPPSPGFEPEISCIGAERWNHDSRRVAHIMCRLLGCYLDWSTRCYADVIRTLQIRSRLFYRCLWTKTLLLCEPWCNAVAKLISSAWSGALRAYLAKGLLLRRSIFFTDTGMSRAGTALPFFRRGCSCTNKNLGHPAKAQDLRVLKLGFHLTTTTTTTTTTTNHNPNGKPMCPRGGPLNCRRMSCAGAVNSRM